MTEVLCRSQTSEINFEIKDKLCCCFQFKTSIAAVTAAKVVALDAKRELIKFKCS